MNIILIGMPGCGKSTVASLLGDKLGRKVIDADTVITEMAGISIPEIFEQQGEAGFRALETKALEHLGKQSGMILATGGGCVTRPENYPLLHQNGRIFLLERDLDQLATDGRPLSRANKLSEMYAIRRPLYDAFADHRINNNGAIEETVRQILSILEESE